MDRVREKNAPCIREVKVINTTLLIRGGVVVYLGYEIYFCSSVE